MSNSKRWSNASAPCRLEWGPSRLLAASLLILGVLAAAGALASELPWQAALSLAVTSLVHAVVTARRELHRPVRTVVVPHGTAEATIDGQPIFGLELHWRGPLAFLRWRCVEGRRGYLLGWPDNLDAAARRELRLAAAARVPLRTPGSMAP